MSDAKQEALEAAWNVFSSATYSAVENNPSDVIEECVEAALKASEARRAGEATAFQVTLDEWDAALNDDSANPLRDRVNKRLLQRPAQPAGVEWSETHAQVIARAVYRESMWPELYQAGREVFGSARVCARDPARELINRIEVTERFSCPEDADLCEQISAMEGEIADLKRELAECREQLADYETLKTHYAQACRERSEAWGRYHGTKAKLEEERELVKTKEDELAALKSWRRRNGEAFDALHAKLAEANAVIESKCQLIQNAGSNATAHRLRAEAAEARERRLREACTPTVNEEAAMQSGMGPDRGHRRGYLERIQTALGVDGSGESLGPTAHRRSSAQAGSNLPRKAHDTGHSNSDTAQPNSSYKLVLPESGFYDSVQAILPFKSAEPVSVPDELPNASESPNGSVTLDGLAARVELVVRAVRCLYAVTDTSEWPREGRALEDAINALDAEGEG